MVSDGQGYRQKRFRRWLPLFALLIFVFVAFRYWVWAVHREIGRLEICEERTGAPGSFVQVGKYFLHVETAGDGTDSACPLLLVHGFDIRGGIRWKRLTGILSKERRVLVPDLLGFGHSQRVELPAHEYSHAGQAALLAHLIRELGLKSVDVAGSSYGGGVAAQLALDFPDIVRRLVIVDGQVYELGGGVFQAMGRLPWGIGSALTRKALVSPFADEPFARIRGTTAALQALNRVAIDARIPEDLYKLRLPVLLVWGEKDRLFPLAQARRLLRDLPNATLEIIPCAGHSPQAERPDDVAARILYFLDSAVSSSDRFPVGSAGFRSPL